MSLLFLDVATVPDFKLGERLYNLHDLSEKDIARVMSTKNRENSKNPDKSRNHLLKISDVSVLLLTKDGISLKSSSDSNRNELDHLNFLSAVIEQHKPEIITWDASTILPLLNYRYLANSSPIPLSGDTPVVNLISELSEPGEYSDAPLHEITALCGLPVTKTLSDDEILNAYLQGSHELIRNQLELNVINTCLIYQRWLLVCGEIDRSAFGKMLKLIKTQLADKDQNHLTHYAAELV